MRNVLVTGGSRGLGLAICQTLNRAGFRVIAVARQQNDRLLQAIEQAESLSSGSFHFVALDLADLEALATAVRDVRKKFGPIYGLVNNAGISDEGLLALMSHTKIERMVRLNTLSPMILTKYVVRSMMADGGGRIVNVSSITAWHGFVGLAVYSATKASLLGFTHALAREVGSAGVLVNAVAPGFLDTEMTQELTEEHRQKIARRSALKRLAAVSDVADAVEFLLSDKAKSITGTVITIDAGSTA